VALGTLSRKYNGGGHLDFLLRSFLSLSSKIEPLQAARPFMSISYARGETEAYFADKLLI
jgi:hypothetical protein